MKIRPDLAEEDPDADDLLPHEPKTQDSMRRKERHSQRRVQQQIKREKQRQREWRDDE